MSSGGFAVRSVRGNWGATGCLWLLVRLAMLARASLGGVWPRLAGGRMVFKCSRKWPLACGLRRQTGSGGGAAHSARVAGLACGLVWAGERGGASEPAGSREPGPATAHRLPSIKRSAPQRVRRSQLAGAVVTPIFVFVFVFVCGRQAKLREHLAS